MMKKVLYGVALTLFAGVSVGSLQSCKDDVNDLATQTSYDLSNLRAQLQAENARLAALIEQNAAAIRLKADIDYVDGLIAGVNSSIADLDARLTAQINTAVNEINQKIEALDGRVGAVETLAADNANRLTEAEAKIAELETKAGLMEAEIADLKDYVQGLPTQADLEEVYLAIEQVNENLTMVLNSLQTQIEEMGEEIRAEVAAQLDAIFNALDAIQAKLDNNVSSILIQGVYSPVFGDFSLPLGVRSNILFGWYGLNEQGEDIEFPSNKKAFSATGDVDVDFSKLYPAKYYAPRGYYGDELDQVTLGKVYVTINPINPNRENLEVQLETSAGTVLPWKVKLTPSDYELKFGYTRSADNGFYEGEVIAPIAEARAAVGVEVNDGLEESIKSILKDPSRATAKDLVKAVYDQLADKLPAYAVRYNWTSAIDELDPGFSSNSVAVLSQYDLAVATAKPLSYNFLKGYNGDRKLPEIGHIQNLLERLREEAGKLTFDFGDPFTVEGFEFKFNDIILTDLGAEIKVELPKIEVKDDQGNVIGTSVETTVPKENIDTEGLLSAIQNAINDALGEASEELNTNIANMVDSINDNVKKMFDNINSQISGKIDQVVDGVANRLEPYFGKIDQAIDIFNKVINKVNNFLENPNAYLQVAAFYNMNNGMGIVSGRIEDPTPFYFTDGGNTYFKLYLSSYTGELIVPACKKYVAITGVYDLDLNPVSVDLDALNKAVNKDKFNNGILDGNEVVVLADARALDTDKIYEFTYQALDFRGYTSTTKFYIEVK